MQAEHILSFGLYRLDLAGARLWRGKHEVKLTGKAFAVLRHLVTHAGDLVTKDALFQVVWPETVVSDAALVSCIKELRHALRDQAPARRYIATVHRRGYRFLPAVTAPPEGGRQNAEGSQEAESRKQSPSRGSAFFFAAYCRPPSAFWNSGS